MAMFVVLKLGCNVQKSLNLFGHACLKTKEIGENANKKAEMGMLITYYREIKIGIKVIFFEY